MTSTAFAVRKSKQESIHQTPNMQCSLGDRSNIGWENLSYSVCLEKNTKTIHPPKTSNLFPLKLCMVELLLLALSAGIAEVEEI